jgi:hypothetical protein
MSSHQETAAVPAGSAEGDVRLAALVDAWAEALASPRSRERYEAIRALRALGPAAEPAIPALIGAFRDPKVELRQRVVRVLAGLGKAAVPALIQAMRDEDADVRKVAIVTLGMIGPEAADAEPQLVQALKDEWLAGTAAASLVRIRRRQPLRLSRLGRLVPWLLAAWVVVAAGGVVTAALAWVNQGLFGFPAPAVAASGSILCGVGVTLGAVLGWSRGSVRALVVGPAALGLAGLLAGLLLGGVLSGALEPVREALAR